MCLTNEIGNFLEQRAQLGPDQAVIFYGDLANRFDLPPIVTWNLHPLREIFGTLDQEDAAMERPFRTALVVRMDGGMPGPGFFTTLGELRDVIIPNAEQERYELFLGELNNLCEYWSNV
jgi:hypothetical protein